MTKGATVLFFNWIKEANLLNEVLIVNSVHDEIVVECPKSMAEEVANKLQECMETAGNYYCRIVPIKAQPVITEFWEH